MHIAGSTVLLTGVTGGIGQTLARGLTAKGAKLVITGRRPEALHPLAEELGARAVVADLADPEQVTRLAGECADIDILIANAALPSSGPLLEYTPEQVERALAVNLGAPIMLARLLAPRMVEAGAGHLLFLGSMSGKIATKSTSLYNATKFGLRGFAHSFRKDLHGTGVGVSIVHPGYVRDAGMFADTGATPPSGIGTVSPGQVAAAVAKAIERDLCELTVAPVALKTMVAFGSQFPNVTEKMQRRMGADTTAEQMTRAQRDRR